MTPFEQYLLLKHNVKKMCRAVESNPEAELFLLSVNAIWQCREEPMATAVEKVESIDDEGNARTML